VHPMLTRALARNARARQAFENLTPYRRKEIARYLLALKTDEARARNIDKVLRQLEGPSPRGIFR
jgi:uncharacterized protein YdeI (YjbR/CyaY-like superfamily)